MTPRVKICGITTAEGMDAAVAAGADWVGFNFFAASPRHVSPAAAAALAARPGVPIKVGLFVKPTDDEIATTLATVPLDVLQIYADAPRVAAIRARFGRLAGGALVWRPIGVATPADLPHDAQGVDGFLIEAKPPPGATRPGGNAVAFDWSILAGWQAPAPWLLAGGLHSGNVAGAIRVTGTPAVDVASGVERQKGIKDPALVRAFIRAARDAYATVRPPFHILPASPDDTAALGMVHVQAWREAYPGLVPDSVLVRQDPAARTAMWRRVVADGEIVLLARDATGDLVGFIAAGPQRASDLPFAAEIGGLYLLRRAQRRGLGRAMMAAAAGALLARGHAGASLWVLDGNDPAIGFYTALGGRVVGHRALQDREWQGGETAYGWDDLRQLAG